MEPLEIKTVIEQCEDQMFARLALSSRERSLYYHLLRNTHLKDRNQHVFALVPLSRTLNVSESSAREDIRSLDSKGCIKIEEKTRSGHLVLVRLPHEIIGALADPSGVVQVDIEALDFYSDRRLLTCLMEREGAACFYCCRSVRADTCALDHVVAQAVRIDNSYKNIVIACHDCNSHKREQKPDDFLRSLYRKGILSDQDLMRRLHALEQLQGGMLVPVLPNNFG